uniref:Uncharacterized protein n=1 Tax=Rhizophora mucronata TaxID=61149 RepID=A0A2P2J304_RHIMU
MTESRLKSPLRDKMTSFQKLTT